MSGRNSLWLVASMAFACSAEPIASSPAREPEETVAPSWTGCEEFVDDACVVFRNETRVVRFWIDAPSSVALDITFDGVAVDGSASAAEGGTRWEVEVPAGANQLVVSGVGVRGQLGFSWRDHHPAIAMARAAFTSGQNAAACAALDQVPANADALDRYVAKRLSARCAPPGDDASSARIYGEAAELAEANGFHRSFVLAAHAALFTHLELRRDLDQARAWMRRISEHTRSSNELAILEDYSRVLLLRREGMFSDALEAAVSMSRWSDRLGLANYYMLANEARATLLAELGRVDESRALSATLLAAAEAHPKACERARIIHNAAWTQQVLAEAGLEHDPPLPHMLVEAAIYESGECDNVRDRLIARINVASAALSEHDIELAREWLGLIEIEDRATASAELGEQIDYLALGVALESNRWDGISFPLFVTAPAVGDARMRWRATVREAQLLERFGLDAAALDAWRRAEALLDEDAAAVGVSEGRESFISGRTTSAIGLVESLVRHGDHDQALCRARIARGRALRRAVRNRGAGATEAITAFDEFLRVREALERDAAEDWAFSGDELARRRPRRDERRRRALDALANALPAVDGDSDCAALRPRAHDELLLLALPTREDTLVIASGPGGTRVERMPAIPDDDARAQQWSEDLLTRIAGSLEGVELVRMLPVGRAWGVPIHASTLQGAPLVERVAVVYGLDLPAGHLLAPERAEVLVVSDPTGDLPHATDEGERVRVLLQQQRITAQVLGGPAARREDVLAKLVSVDLFHYAGHGEHRGSDGWDDALLLHDHASIESADVLALSHAPRTVVLAGCDTGAVDAGLFDGGMSLGRAFLLAGSDAVVVGDREVDDAVTEAFAVALYEDSAARMLDAPEIAVRDALRKTAASGLPIDAWSGFRLLVR